MAYIDAVTVAYIVTSKAVFGLKAVVGIRVLVECFHRVIGQSGAAADVGIGAAGRDLPLDCPDAAQLIIVGTYIAQF